MEETQVVHLLKSIQVWVHLHQQDRLVKEQVIFSSEWLPHVSTEQGISRALEARLRRHGACGL